MSIDSPLIVYPFPDYQPWGGDNEALKDMSFFDGLSVYDRHL